MASETYRKLKDEDEAVKGEEPKELSSSENKDADDDSVSLDGAPVPIIEDGVGDVADDFTDSGDTVDGRSDPDKKNFKYLKPYHEALICVLIQADSIYKQAEDYRLKRKMRELQRLVDTQIIHLTRFETWAMGTTHLRSDVTNMSGLHGLYVKQKIIDEWENMKRGSESFREQFCRDMDTEGTCQSDENQRLISWNIISHYGKSAEKRNTQSTNFKENLEMMSRDFEHATKALQDLSSDVGNLASCCWIFRYFELERSVDRYMFVVKKILRQRS